MENPDSVGGRSQEVLDRRVAVPPGFRRRILVSVSVLFVGTMMVFLFAMYYSEKDLHYNDTFSNLDETISMMSLLMPSIPSISKDAILDIEEDLDKGYGERHRLFLVDSENRIIISSSPELIGRAVDEVLELRPYGTGTRPWELALYDSESWLVSSGHVGNGPERYRMFMMRLRSDSDKFVSGFLVLHFGQVVVTLLLFFTVLHFLGVYYVRRPIEDLAVLIHRVEGGEFGRLPDNKRNDEFGWLARRFIRMGTRLKDLLEHIVRVEKRAAAGMVAFRIAREMSAPLKALERHILYLEGLAMTESAIADIGNALRKDRETLVDVIIRLKDIQEPEHQQV